MAGSPLIATRIERSYGQITYIIRDTSKTLDPFYIRREEDYLYACGSITATIDHWRMIDPRDWEDEYGGLCSYAGLLDLVETAGGL